MVIMKQFSLGEALERAEACDSASSLFLESETLWSTKTRAQIVRTDRYSLEPLEPIAEGLLRVLSVADLQDVVVNAKEQLNQPTTEQLVEALRYYVLKDAFMIFKRKHP